MNQDDGAVLNTREDLVLFLRNRMDPREFEYRKQRFEVTGLGVLDNLAASLLLPQIIRILSRFTGFKLREPGSYVRFHFPTPLDADLLLTSNREPAERGAAFSDCFFVDAADMERVQKLLTPQMTRALLSLHRRYYVRMTDLLIEFGPIGDNPEESANAVATLAEALPEIQTPNENGFHDSDLAGTPFVVVKTVSSNVQANLLALALQSRGIPARLLHGAQSAVWGNMNTGLGVQVTVPAALREEAVEVLTTATPKNNSNDTGSDS